LHERVILIANDARSLGDKSIPIFADINKGKGPNAGIHSALTHCQTPWMAVMPVDMPYLETGIYHYLSPFCTYENPVVAESDAGLEPLVSFWPKST